MKRNIGDIDANIRIMLGFFLAYWYVLAQNPTIYQKNAFILAIVLMITAIHGSCPFYRIFNIDTCKNNSCGDSPKKRRKQKIFNKK